jgi:hypothetical protein
MTIAANAITTAIGYAQLHSGAAGGSGTSNVTTAARQAISWASPTGPGTIALATPIGFTGGAASGPVYSVTLWSASSGGTFFGEFPTTGDTTFSGSGVYSITALDLVGAAT